MQRHPFCCLISISIVWDATQQGYVSCQICRLFALKLITFVIARSLSTADVSCFPRFFLLNLLSTRPRIEGASMHERERPGLRSQLIFGVLNRVTGHSKPIDARRPRPSISAPSHGRRMSSLQPPPPLSPPLPRRNARLTPPPPPSYCPNDETPNLPDWDQQFQSPFMRLPVEIQMLIYEHVIGNRVIHIIRRNDMKGGMGHMSCLTDGNFELCNEMNCRGMKLPTGLFIESRSDHSHLLPLLQSCKMV